MSMAPPRVAFLLVVRLVGVLGLAAVELFLLAVLGLLLAVFLVVALGLALLPEPVEPVLGLLALFLAAVLGLAVEPVLGRS